jgi:DNA/RNA endonuclease YhcR with UshA esterase domain
MFVSYSKIAVRGGINRPYMLTMTLRAFSESVSSNISSSEISAEAGQITAHSASVSVLLYIGVEVSVLMS